MFLTRFRLNTARNGSRRLLSSPQAMHAAVMSSFPTLLPGDAPAPDGQRVLWRLDQSGRGEVMLHIVSPDRPDLTHLVEQAGWPAAASTAADNPGWETKPYAPLLDRLSAGDHWAFRLTANPVHSIRRKDDEPIKITAHLTPLHQKDWLLTRQERCGFRILEKPDDRRLLPDGTTHQGRPHHGDRHELSVGDMRSLSFSKSRNGSGGRGREKPVTLVTVTYDGRLEITDPDALRRTLVQGIGRAKGYGCGLLTLAPLAPTAAGRTP